ncbi:ChaB family protein [Fictibacillus sp. NRS-1165]|uniref:ChaB family protein n=1 Tax=Fictibacillus sp. NRS-1165 TaxID=3144463 RepID=UPI003D213CBD
MPYDSIKELPDQVRDNLPHHAQEIFKEAFNSASEEYKEEETAFKVAWSAVKKKYEKNSNDKWVKKDKAD